MKGWNHRIIEGSFKFLTPYDEVIDFPFATMVEVYYKDDGVTIEGYTDPFGAVVQLFDSTDDLEGAFKLMLQSFGRPTLKLSELEPDVEYWLEDGEYVAKSHRKGTT